MSGGIPSRCFTCGKIFTGPMWDEFKEVHDKIGDEPDRVLDTLGLRRMCCRRMFKGHSFELDDMLLRNPPVEDVQSLDIGH